VVSDRSSNPGSSHAEAGWAWRVDSREVECVVDLIPGRSSTPFRDPSPWACYNVGSADIIYTRPTLFVWRERACSSSLSHVWRVTLVYFEAQSTTTSTSLRLLYSSTHATSNTTPPLKNARKPTRDAVLSQPPRAPERLLLPPHLRHPARTPTSRRVRPPPLPLPLPSPTTDFLTPPPSDQSSQSKPSPSPPQSPTR